VPRESGAFLKLWKFAMKMKKKLEIALDKISFGVVLSILGIFMILYSRTFPKVRMGEKMVTGPSFFPTIIGLLLVIFGIYTIIFNLLLKKRVYKEQKVFINLFCTSNEFLNFFIFIFLIALYPTIVNLLGFFIGSFLFCIILMKRLQARWINTILSSLIIIIFTWIVFGKIAFISLPKGIIFNR